MNRKKIQGRVALIEKLVGNNTIVLIFETPESVTGKNLAVIGCFGVKTIQDIEPGKTRYAQFCARSELTFDEEIASAREYKGARIHIGNYQGIGKLNDDPSCAFSFSTDVFKYKWWLGQVEKMCTMAFWKKKRHQQCLVLERTG